jgi:hypothetical protein
MNYRHSGWRHGYRYFASYSRRQGLWRNDLGDLSRWLTEHYGPKTIELYGPVTREEMSRDSFWHTPTAGFYRNPHWFLDTNRRRVYVTEETLTWARLSGRIS